MAIKILFDNDHNVIMPTFVLATRSGKKIGAIPASEIQLSDNLNPRFELSFRVYRYDNGVECRLWDSIKDLRLLWCPEWDVWFEMYVEVNEDEDTVKNITAKSLGEAELSQINLYGIEINTENDIARDDYEPTVLFNEKYPNASLMNRILEKAPHYKIVHVDSSIAGIQRTFTFDDVSLYDAFQQIAEEISCIFIIDSGSNSDGSIRRSISIFDLESYCTSCGHRGSFLDQCPECGSKDIRTGYGDDTSIFVCTDNLADGITYTTNVDAVKNCFKLEAGDDLMTATVRNCNPNGSDYIWYITDETKADMSAELAAKLNAYDELYQYYKKTYSTKLNSSILSKYNTLITKYKKYSPELESIPASIVGYAALMNAYYNTIEFALYLQSELMPTVKMSDTTAAAQVKLLTTANLSPVAVADLSKCSSATATSAVLAMAKVLVDSRYQVKVSNGTLSGASWSGTFTVTNFSDDEDTATSAKVNVTINDNLETFVKQKLSKALDSQNSDTVLDDLFKLNLAGFKAEIQKYCLASLTSFHDACQSCLDILIQQGIADDETWADGDPNLYEKMYTPYYQKLLALEDEIKLRESEIATIIGIYDKDGMLASDGLQTLIEKENESIQNALNFEKYVGNKLWLEFVAYRREDTYRNDNFISDGLTNSELFDTAREFIGVAEEEIFKSATLQHSITGTLKNLLVMKEFAPLIEHFKVGNWIRVRVNDDIYRLRIVAYQIDFDDLDSLSITFSDVTIVRDGITDSMDVLNRAASMATSYDSVSRQASQGKKASQVVNNIVSEGLALTKTKIIDSAENQNITWDSHGLLCREYLPITDSYDVQQLKIINRGLYLTDDNWLTARAGIGNFMYYDPSDGETKEAYGVIADTLIGNLILSEKVGIYNKNNSITLDENGIILTATAYDGDGRSIFTVRRKSVDEAGNPVYTNVIYMDTDGNAHFDGIINATSGKFTGDVIASSLIIEGTTADDYVNSRVTKVTDSIEDSLDELIDVVDGKTTTYYGSTAPKDPDERDIWYDTSTGTIKRYSGGRWVDITDEALKKALDKAGDAQATADGKIRTFAQATAPTGMTAKDVGDLWIDTSDNNKLYRWNGSKWVEYRDKLIQTARDEATAARELANNIYNGATGIYFQNNTVGTCVLNNKVGLKITGSDGTYFQVMNKAMGFFDSKGVPLLYYENGNMVLTGTIAAKAGYIGGEGGWIIGTNSMYNGKASSLGAAGGIFLGTAGISISDAIIMEPSGRFVIRSDNSPEKDSNGNALEDGNYVFKIEPTKNSSGATIYTLYIGDVIFDSSFVLPAANGGLGGTDRDTVSDMTGLHFVTSEDDLNSISSPRNGDLGVIYSDGEEGASIVGEYTTSGGLAIGHYANSGHKQSDTHFGIKGYYWNIPGLSGEEIYDGYARVGVGETPSGKCAMYAPINVTLTNTDQPVTSFTLKFDYNKKPSGRNRDFYSGTAKAVTVAVYNSSNVKVASGSFTPPANSGTATIKLSSTTGLTNGRYYVVFYSGTTHTVVFIKPASVNIPETVTGAAAGLWLYTGGMWRKLGVTA